MKFDKSMKELLNADWAGKERAAVRHRLNRRPFAGYKEVTQTADMRMIMKGLAAMPRMAYIKGRLV